MAKSGVSRVVHASPTELGMLSLGWLFRRLWVYRAGLTPIYTALVVWLTGVTLRAWVPGWWPTPLLLGLATAAAVWLLGDKMSGPWQRLIMLLVPERLDEGQRGVLDRPTERTYLAVLLTCVGGWLSAMTQYGSTPTVKDAWWVGALVLAVPWWWHRGFRRRKKPNRWARRWRHVADTLPEFEGSKVTRCDGDRNVTELSVTLRGGKTVYHVGDKAMQVASALSSGLRPGAVTIAGHELAARRVKVRIVPRDPWGGTIPHPLPAIGSVDLGHDDRVMIALLEDRASLLHKLAQHTLLCGQSGSGKSVLLDTMLAWMAIADEPVIAADLANGVSLGDWEPMLATPLATKASEASVLLDGVMNVVAYRERQMRAMKVKKWPHKNLFVVIDEFPSLVKGGGQKMIDKLVLIAERARKTGVWLYPAAQNGTKHDLGSTEFRAQMMCTIGLRLDRHMSTLLWGDLSNQGWDSTSLATGTLLLRDATRNSPRVAKAAMVTDAQRDKLVREVARRGPRELDAGSLRALQGVEVSEPMGTTLVSSRPVVEPPKPTPLPGQPVRRGGVRLASAELDERVLDELAEEHQGGQGSTPISQQLDVSRDQVERSLRRLAASGRAKNIGRGWVRL